MSNTTETGPTATTLVTVETGGINIVEMEDAFYADQRTTGRRACRNRR